MLKISEEEFFENIGKHLIIFLKENNCNQVLLVLGKHFRDFINGLDNLYDYLNFLLPEIKSLSFVCENESATGLRLNYQCSKIFLAYYTVGIIKQIAREYYNKELLIQVEFEEYLTDLVRITYNLIFDNEEFYIASYPFIFRRYNSLPISPHLILQIFPFGILFRKDLIIKHFGTSLFSLLAYAIGNKMSKYFKIIRPSMPFHFRNIQSRVSSTFELETINPVKSYRQMTSLQDITHIIQHKVTLKGQMVFVEEWDMMLFLGTPVMPDLEYVSDIGLYMNDLSMHDFSRDLMLAGTQQSATLRLALEQEQEKTMKLEDSLARLSEERRRTDQLLYQMIPESIADTLRKGLSPMKTCKKFNNVSILYSDVVKFTEICSKITAMEVVSMLNGMYSIFDSLTEQLKVFKVETIGDAYTVVSGAPDHAFDHAARIANLALNMVKAIKTMHDPSTGSHLKIRIGIHSGPVVAGIVGMKMPRYCLFGETASIASLMESTSQPMKIHITEAVQKLLPHDFVTSDNFKVDVTRQTDLKNCKGLTKTFWLEDRLNVCNVRITEDTIN
ncbi:soluble guanylate cyclase 88E-like [Rhodnius prolixus]|uniref:soluble guanylate cyclase 88E-like n=1 Tax=Rhodnius prolixus TaxID=13249 RepID=UPI003D18CE72